MARIAIFIITYLFFSSINAQYLTEVDIATLAELSKNQEKYEGDFGYSSDAKLPSHFSLSDYCVVGSQGESSSCTGFAVANGAMSILYNIVNGVTKFNERWVHRFDPFYIYSSLKDPNDLECIANGGCNCGSLIYEALDIIENYGCKKLYLYPNLECGSTLNKTNLRSLVDVTGNYSIDGYANLIEYKETSSGYKTKVDIKLIKEVLNGLNPVIGGIRVGNDFNNLSANNYAYSAPQGSVGRHAITIIGYDDNKFGGAFHVLNSYGSDWGDDGYFWISYKDFKDQADVAYVILKDNWDAWRDPVSSSTFYKGEFASSETKTWEGPVNSEGLFHGRGIIEDDGYSAIGQYENGFANGWWMIFEDSDVPDAWAGWALFENGELIETEDFGFSSSTIQSLDEVKKSLHTEIMDIQLNSSPASVDDLSNQIINSISSRGQLK